MTKPSYIRGIIVASLTILIVAAAAIIYERAFSRIEPGLYLNEGKLSDAQKESLKVMLDLHKLLMNWALAVIGATGFFLKLNVEKDVPLRQLDLIFSFGIIILAFFSLFLGHFAIDKSAQMLSLDQFPVNDESIRSVARYQYVTGLGAIALFGFHVFHYFWVRLCDPQISQSKGDIDGASNKNT